METKKMGVYRYLLSGKKRSVAIEKYNGVWMDQHERDIHETPSEWNKEDLQNQSNPYYPKQKPTLMLVPFAYKLGFGDDAWMGWKGRKAVAASKAADKEYQNWIDAGENSIVWNWCGYESEFSSVRFTLPVSHLCVLADSWEDEDTDSSQTIDVTKTSSFVMIDPADDSFEPGSGTYDFTITNNGNFEDIFTIE